MFGFLGSVPINIYLFLFANLKRIVMLFLAISYFSIFFNSEENVDLNSFHSDSPRCLTSTQKGDRPQRCEKFSDANSSLDIGNLSVIEPKNRCCNPTVNKVSTLLQNVFY